MSVQQPIESYGLGSRIAEFKPRNEIFAAVLFIGFGLFCVFVGGIAALGAQGGGSVGGCFISAIGLLIVCAVVAYIVNRTRQGNRTLTLFQDGWAYGKKSEPPVVMRWNDLQDFRIRVLQKVFITPHSFHMRGDYQFVLTGKDGQTVTIKEQYPQIESVADLLWNMVAKSQTPAALENFQQGKTLTFGSLRVNNKGIDNGIELLGWDRLDHISIQGGNVILRTRIDSRWVEWVNIRVEDFPNLPVFIAIAASPGVNKFQGKMKLARTTFGI
jgi:hypothetical protein